MKFKAFIPVGLVLTLLVGLALPTQTKGGEAEKVFVKPHPSGSRPVLSILGSSLGKGWKASGYYTGTEINGSIWGSYGALLTLSLTQRDWQVVNQSIPGDNTTLVRKRFDADEVPVHASEDLLALSLGNEGLPGAPNPQQIFNHYFTGITNLIAMSRAHHILPVVGNNYPRDSYTPTEYRYLKKMDLLMNTLNVPSVNFLGALDDGHGHWVSNSFVNLGAGDGIHPNDAGDREMFLCIVPTVFDALREGKPTPHWGSRTNYLRLVADAQQPAPLSFTPGSTMHSFTLSFCARTTGTGTVAAIYLPKSLLTPVVEITPTGIVYRASTGRLIRSGVCGTNGAWHEVVVTHQYAGGWTKLYVDGVLAGSTAERLTPVEFVLGGRGHATKCPSSPDWADYQDWFVHRSMMNTEEVNAQFGGALQQASLELYCPLDDRRFQQGKAVINRAQSLSVAHVNGRTSDYRAAAFTAPPASLVAASSGASAITLDWKDPRVKETAYFVERSRAGGQWKSIASLPPHSTKFTDRRVTAGTLYRYRVSYSLNGFRSEYTAPTRGVTAP